MGTAADDGAQYAGAAGLERSRRAWTVLAVVLAAGLVVGAIVGALLGGGAQQYQATAQVSISPDSSVDSNLYPNALQLDTTTFIQGELVRLDSSLFADDVRDRLKLTATPTFTFAQVAQTAIVSVTADASTRAEAKRIANGALATYRAQRSRSLLATISAVSTRTDARLTSVGRQLRAASVAGSSTAATRSSLQSEYSSLLSTSSTLDQDRGEVSSVVTDVQPTRAAAASSSAASAILLGGVLGALVAVLVLLAVRRVRPTVGTLRTLAGLGLPVLLPSMPRSGGGPGTVRARTAGRALAQQLSRRSPGEPLVVTGVTTGVGVTFVAAQLAHALGPSAMLISRSSEAPEFGVELVGYDEDDDGPRSCVATTQWARTTGRPVVVDAPSLDTSDAPVRLLDEGGVGVLVVGRGMSHPIDVFGAGQLLENVGPRVAGALLNDVPLAADSTLGRLARSPLGRLVRQRSGSQTPDETGSDALAARVRTVVDGAARAVGVGPRQPAVSPSRRPTRSPARTMRTQASRRRVPDQQDDQAAQAGGGSKPDPVAAERT